MKQDAQKVPSNDRGQGRKSLSGSGKTPITAIRLAPDQREKLDRLGGSAWVRKAIDSAEDGQAVQSPDKGSQAVDKAVNQALDKIEKGFNKLIENARVKT